MPEAHFDLHTCIFWNIFSRQFKHKFQANMKYKINLTRMYEKVKMTQCLLKLIQMRRFRYQNGPYFKDPFIMVGNHVIL